jgi:hypothetical protein
MSATTAQLSRWRQTIAGVFALALVLAPWALAQHQAINALHEAIGEMKTHCRPPHIVQATPAPLSPGALQIDERGQGRAADDPSDREALERHGADLLVANNYEEALGHYRLLARLFPHDRAFSDLVVVLEAKLGCRNRGRSKSWPCL